MLGSPFDAEDAVQDAFVRAWKSREKFEGRSAMRSWLYRIATNVCLDTSVASVNSALQRARATLAKANAESDGLQRKPLSAADREMLDRYVTAFEAYDLGALTALIREDAKQSMPPFDMWLRGRDDV